VEVVIVVVVEVRGRQMVKMRLLLQGVDHRLRTTGQWQMKTAQSVVQRHRTDKRGHEA